MGIAKVLHILLISAVDTGNAVLLMNDILKTEFLTRYGLYKWVMMPMGLTMHTYHVHAYYEQPIL